MKFLKEEKGLTKVQFTVVAAIVMVIVAFTILLALGENGFSLKTEAENVTKNTVKNEIVDNTVYR